MKVRFIEIPPEPRVRFFTAHDNMKRKQEEKLEASVTRLLEAEQWRLIQTWAKD